MEIRRYSNLYKEQWDSFVSNAKNATFLFHRDFMEYHQDRFEDYSLMIFQKNILVALVPANISNNIVYSHQGLTYGAIVLEKDTNFNKFQQILQGILKFLAKNNLKQFIIKPIPKIYNTSFHDELTILLPIVNATPLSYEISLSTTISETYSFSKLRMRGIKKGIKNKLIFQETNELEPFWNQILIPNLLEKHKSKPLHSLEEISKLKKKFPKNIRQFDIYYENQIIAGTTIFDTQQTAHSQYISGKKEFNHLGGLDLLFNELITNIFKHKKFFNFGTSASDQENKINKGVFNWKHGFDTLPVLHNQYSIETANYKNLETIFV